MMKASSVDIELVEARSPIKPSRMSASLYQYLEQAAQAHAPDSWMHLPSGAFHDAGIMASLMPSAMLFIPSINGISHDFAEDSHKDDLVLGCQVMASAVAAMLAEHL
jgi:N-carbamoyl-L-amino-acid hydrolase